MRLILLTSLLLSLSSCKWSEEEALGVTPAQPIIGVSGNRPLNGDEIGTLKKICSLYEYKNNRFIQYYEGGAIKATVYTQTCYERETEEISKDILRYEGDHFKFEALDAVGDYFSDYQSHLQGVLANLCYDVSNGKTPRIYQSIGTNRVKKFSFKRDIALTNLEFMVDYGIVDGGKLYVQETDRFTIKKSGNEAGVVIDRVFYKFNCIGVPDPKYEYSLLRSKFKSLNKN